jgi:hypothetical protein
MEIEFRGKSVETGEWLFGSLINNVFYKDDGYKTPCCYIVDNKALEKYDCDCWEDIANILDDYEVIPESVGQFTGEYDYTEWCGLTIKEQEKWLSEKGNTEKNWHGKRIYEGDIIQLNNDWEYTLVEAWGDFEVSDRDSDIGNVRFEKLSMNVVGNETDDPKWREKLE